MVRQLLQLRIGYYSVNFITSGQKLCCRCQTARRTHFCKCGVADLPKTRPFLCLTMPNLVVLC